MGLGLGTADAGAGLFLGVCGGVLCIGGCEQVPGL